MSKGRVLDGKVAVVTGAARGIGRGYALRLGGLGASVVVGDINFDSAKELGIDRPSIVDEVSALGVQCEGVVCDVTSRESAQSLIDRAVDRFGRVDVVVCNVGGSGKSDSYASTVPPDEFEAAIALNLFGIVYVCQAAAPRLKEHGWGKIVMVSSTAGVRSALGGWHAPYGTAKAGVLGYMIHLAEELGAFNITVNAIAPGYIRHDRSAASHGESESAVAYWKEVSDAACMRRSGTIDDCAGVIEFLCTPLSDFVTGQLIFADGGLTVRDAADSPS
jgi:3-oxoacyl-[acyl-carrier protein] reductase